MKTKDYALKYIQYRDKGIYYLVKAVIIALLMVYALFKTEYYEIRDSVDDMLAITFSQPTTDVSEIGDTGYLSLNHMKSVRSYMLKALNDDKVDTNKKVFVSYYGGVMTASYFYLSVLVIWMFLMAIAVVLWPIFIMNVLACLIYLTEAYINYTREKNYKYVI